MPASFNSSLGEETKLCREACQTLVGFMDYTDPQSKFWGIEGILLYYLEKNKE